MQDHDSLKQSNVVSLFTARQKEEDSTEQSEPMVKKSSASFEEIMMKNTKNKERLAKERATANKSVLKSYRIKH